MEEALGLPPPWILSELGKPATASATARSITPPAPPTFSSCASLQKRAAARPHRPLRRLGRGREGTARFRVLRQPSASSPRLLRRCDNLDPHVVLPAARDIELIGVGHTSLEDDFAPHRERAKPSCYPRAQSRSGLVFPLRSLPLCQARRPCPRLPGRARPCRWRHCRGPEDRLRLQRQLLSPPCDQFDAKWIFAGSVQEANVAFSLGKELAGSTA